MVHRRVLWWHFIANCPFTSLGKGGGIGNCSWENLYNWINTLLWTCKNIWTQLRESLQLDQHTFVDLQNHFNTVERFFTAFRKDFHRAGLGGWWQWVVLEQTPGWKWKRLFLVLIKWLIFKWLISPQRIRRESILKSNIKRWMLANQRIRAKSRLSVISGNIHSI